MSEILYRRMAYEEIDGLLKTNKFIIPMNHQLYLPRKWFTTSILKAQYFKNPYHYEETGMIRLRVTDDYYKKIFDEGELVIKEVLGSAAIEDYKSKIVYARTHKTVDELYNIGISDFDELNEKIVKVEEISEKEYEDIIDQHLKAEKYASKSNESLDYLEFYVQGAEDIASYMLQYQTLMTEAINPIIKVMHFDKNLKRLRKNNLNRFSTTLKVRFNKAIIARSLFDENSFSMTFADVLKNYSLIERVERVSIDDINNDRALTMQVKGNNTYQKHVKKEFKEYNRLSFREFEIITLKLFKPDFTIDQLFEYIPNLRDINDINQVNPRHIDNVKTHIEKSIIMSNLILNHFSKTININSRMMTYVKWILLMHDLGKPYCECDSMTTRFTQFGEYINFRDMIINQLLDEDIAFPLSQIFKIFTQESTTGKKKINKIINSIINETKKYYKTENVEEYLSEFINAAFLAKISHTASLKTRTFHALYVDDLMYFDRIKKAVSKTYNFDFKYDEYYYSLFDTCDKFLDSYYQSDKVSTILTRLLKEQKQDTEESVLEPDVKEVLEKIMRQKEIISKLDFKDSLLTEIPHHGMDHSKRVGIFSQILATLKECTKEEQNLLLIASQYHDIGRMISGDLHHSEESVNLLKESGKFEDYDLVEYLYYVIESHGFDDIYDEKILNKYNIKDKEKAIFLSNIFKDADALDRVRFNSFWSNNIKLNVELLRNPESKKLINFANALNDAFNEDVKALNEKNRQMIKVEK